MDHLHVYSFLLLWRPPLPLVLLCLLLVPSPAALARPGPVIGVAVATQSLSATAIPCELLWSTTRQEIEILFLPWHHGNMTDDAGGATATERRDNSCRAPSHRVDIPRLETDWDSSRRRALLYICRTKLQYTLAIWWDRQYWLEMRLLRFPSANFPPTIPNLPHETLPSQDNGNLEPAETASQILMSLCASRGSVQMVRKPVQPFPHPLAVRSRSLPEC